jgi:hypothetical protein
MSTQLTGLVRSFTADAAITKNRVVKITSTGAAAATADTDLVIGVSQLTVATGEQCPVAMSGTSKITASAAISIGDLVVATTGGKIATTTTDKKRVIGTALEAATADGDLIEVLLTPATTTSL